MRTDRRTCRQTDGDDGQICGVLRGKSQYHRVSINQSINLFCHTQTQLAVISIANTFRLCVMGSTQGAYAPHKRATHVQ